MDPEMYEDEAAFEDFPLEPEDAPYADWHPTTNSLIHIAVPSPAEKEIAPPTSTTTSSELSSALEDRPRPLPSRYTRTSPPPHYNPYPYDRTWRLYRPVLGKEQYMWYHREDEWTTISTGAHNKELERRVFATLVHGIHDRQHVAKKAWEEEQLLEQSPPAPLRVTPPPELEHLPFDPESLVDHRFDIEFMTASQEKGIPVRTLMSGRRAVERNMHSPRERLFEDYYQDNVWVRIKWSAYPDHEPVRSVLVTFRCARKPGQRRPCTRLELAVALTAVITRYYDEVTVMEPHPAFEHLALGSGEGRVSVYALRMMGIRAAENGIYDLQLELDTSEADAQQSSESTNEVKIIEPSWSSVLPVTCTLAPPPKVPYRSYFSHLDPATTSTHTMPSWPDR